MAMTATGIPVQNSLQGFGNSKSADPSPVFASNSVPIAAIVPTSEYKILDATSQPFVDLIVIGAQMAVLSQIWTVNGITRTTGHSYPASAANCWDADWPEGSNCRLRIICATSRPSSVEKAEPKDLKPFTLM